MTLESPARATGAADLMSYMQRRAGSSSPVRRLGGRSSLWSNDARTFQLSFNSPHRLCQAVDTTAVPTLVRSCELALETLTAVRQIVLIHGEPAGRAVDIDATSAADVVLDRANSCGRVRANSCSTEENVSDAAANSSAASKTAAASGHA